MEVLDNLQSAHNIENDLYVSIKKHIEHNDLEDVQAISAFVEKLPHDMRRSLSMVIYKNVYEEVDFMIGKTERFIAWICPILKTRVSAPRETIFREGDPLTEVFFLKSGSCHYVLPKYADQPFL